MRSFALISQKGGAGKSTLTRSLAVLAGEDGPSYVVDRDPQGSCREWFDRRQAGETAPEQPELLDLGATKPATALGRMKAKPGTVWFDTRPQVEEPEAEIARAVDVVIVPVKPSIDDIKAVTGTLAMVQRLKIRPLIVVNAARSPGRAIEARAALSRYGYHICPHHISDRTVFLDAAIEGRAAHEMRGAAAKAAGAELRNVWSWIQETINEQSAA
jgi:chromosome partitioning protein